MDTNLEWRLHGSHLPNAVKEALGINLLEIEAATNAFLDAAGDFVRQPNQDSAERVWMSSRLAWSLLLPYRTQVIQMNRTIAENFREGVQTLRGFLATHMIPPDDNIPNLATDLAHRQSLLDALLESNGESKIRELLKAAR
jgi:hypothetical protein